jgi:phage/plasmid-like protein (TIGR03299 family)
MTITADRPVDVNEAFRAEKLNQTAAAFERRDASLRRIADYESGATQAAMDAKLAADVASGKIRMVSPDRYEVLEGWDRNEYFTVQRASRPQEAPLILAEHGLDTRADGKAAVYSSTPQWHDAGTVIPGGISDFAQVLRFGGIDYGQRLVPATYEWDGETHTDPDFFHNVREDTGASLGVVGKTWRPVQSIQAGAFLENLVNEHGLTWDAAGALKGGRRTFVSLAVPGWVTIDAEGINDQIKFYLVALDDRTGHAKFRTVVTPWNPVCANTERFAYRDAATSWGISHSGLALGEAAVKEARRTLGLAIRHREVFATEQESLLRTEFEIGAFRKLVDEVLPADKPWGEMNKRERTNRLSKVEALEDAFGLETARVGRNAYAAERAVTRWADNTSPRKVQAGKADLLRAARATAVLTGADDDTKARAHRALLTLTHR